jgi:hypothetical protein
MPVPSCFLLNASPLGIRVVGQTLKSKRCEARSQTESPILRQTFIAPAMNLFDILELVLQLPILPRLPKLTIEKRVNTHGFQFRRFWQFWQLWQFLQTLLPSV